MITAAETSRRFSEAPEHWRIALMDLVDDVRSRRDSTAFGRAPMRVEVRLDAMLASVVEMLCKELGDDPPDWVHETPGCPRAWFVSGLENVKAIALAESPLPFRIRQIFVLENFLYRV